MDKEFLEGLGLEEGVIDAILSQHGKVVREHESRLAAVQLAHSVESAVHRAGGRNVKAISALLDMESIQGSDDIPTALDTALQALKKENGYLFAGKTPPPYAPFTGAHQGENPQPATLAGALRERMGRK